MGGQTCRGTDGEMDGRGIDGRGWMEGRTDGWMEGWTDRGTDGETDRGTDGGTDGRTTCAILLTIGHNDVILNVLI